MNYWIKASGEILEVTPKDGKSFSLEELKRFVGGYIEAIFAVNLKPLTFIQPDSVMFVNEDGKRLNLPINLIATRLFQFGDIDQVRGNVLLTTREAAGG